MNIASILALLKVVNAVRTLMSTSFGGVVPFQILGKLIRTVAAAARIVVRLMLQKVCGLMVYLRRRL